MVFKGIIVIILYNETLYIYLTILFKALRMVEFPFFFKTHSFSEKLAQIQPASLISKDLNKLKRIYLGILNLIIAV